MPARRGVVLLPDDLHERWLDLLGRAELNVLALHGAVEDVIAYVRGEAGKAFLGRARQMGLEIEYELHAMSFLLPRAEFEKHPEWFRADEDGNRTADANLCPSSGQALAAVAKNAAALADVLSPTTRRYYLWADDGRPWCRCGRCAGLSCSDQNLMTMNAILTGLRRRDPASSLAFLAYHNTLDPPEQTEPLEGIFLEYAPIARRPDRPLRDPAASENTELADKLGPLIDFFGTDGAQVLEYWLDVSRFSKYRRPAVEVAFDRNVLADDVDFYAKSGFRSITTFACYMDSEYFGRYDSSPVIEYGRELRGRGQ